MVVTTNRHFRVLEPAARRWRGLGSTQNTGGERISMLGEGEPPGTGFVSCTLVVDLWHRPSKVCQTGILWPRALELDDRSATRPEEGKMKMLPQVLFWLGIVSIPLAWILWYFGPQIELVRPVLSGIDDAALRAVLQEAHGERLGIFVALWPVTLLVLSQVVEKRVQE